MTRTISTALLALALGLGTPALAQDSQLATEAQNTLDRYEYEVDATMLSEEQLAQFQTYFGGDGVGDDPAQARQRIDEILMMDAGTATFISADMQAMFDNPTELEANARSLLDSAGFSEVDVSGLTNAQLAQLWFLKDDNSSTDGDNTVRLRVESILDES
jgi:hypothetical protein